MGNLHTGISCGVQNYIVEKDKLLTFDITPLPQKKDTRSMKKMPFMVWRGNASAIPRTPKNQNIVQATETSMLVVTTHRGDLFARSALLAIDRLALAKASLS